MLSISKEEDRHLGEEMVGNHSYTQLFMVYITIQFLNEILATFIQIFKFVYSLDRVFSLLQRYSNKTEILPQ